jgi:transcriptional regulator with XRE-family HTH domain
MGGSNEALLRWFRQAGWTQLELARAVGRLGRARGHNVAPDSSRVRRWLEGEQPRHPVPELLAALFADRLGRPFTPADLGLTAASPTRDHVSWDHRALVTTLQDFTRSDLMIKRRDVLGATAVLATGAVLEGRLAGWLGPDDHSSPAPALGPGRIGTAEIAEIESATRTFWAWDAKRGGGLYREAVVGQLKAMTDLLDHGYPDPISRRLFRSTADLARLAGWMSHDVGLQATAQRYFTLALHCAKRAGDTGLGVEVLSRMARQLVHVGKPRDALSLVALARRGAGSRLAPMASAMLATCESWAHATLGDVRAVDRAVGVAEAHFSRADPAESPGWLSYFDRAGLEGMAALSYRTVAEHRPGVEHKAEPHLAEALRLRRDTYQRSNLFDVISLVGVRVLQGEHAEANRLAAERLTPTGRISSTRTFDRIEALRDRAVADAARSKDARLLADTLAALVAA